MDMKDSLADDIDQASADMYQLDEELAAYESKK